jgi:hypothetical protein
MELPRAREALERAGRSLDDLSAAKTDDVNAFRDALANALNNLYVVTGLIESESKGNRPNKFSNWWNIKDQTLKNAITQLRHAEVKLMEHKSGSTQALK